MLITASLLVAAAIAIGGGSAKLLNGIGGLIWIGSAVLLVSELKGVAQFAPVFIFTLVECLVLVLIVKPSNFAFAVVGFAIGGASIALRASVRSADFALLLPAMWLPMHLVVAISRAAIRMVTDGGTSVRRDPPPTAALVPFAMIVSTLAGAWIIGWSRRRALRSSVRAEAQGPSARG
jgi:hypothetical protein